MNLFKSRRQRFKEARTPLANEAFIAALHTADADVLGMLAVRLAMGSSLHVPFEYILPDEPLPSLLSLGGESWDMVGFIMGLEEALGVEIPDKLAARCPLPYVGRFFETLSPAPSDFGTWATDVVNFMKDEGICYQVPGPSYHVL